MRGGLELPPSARQLANHAFGQPVDRHEQERAVEDEPVIQEPGQKLRQDGEREAARDRARDAPEPAEEEGQKEDDRGLQREAVGRDVAVQEREERSRSARERGRDGECGDAHVVGGQPQRLRGDLAALDREKGAPPGRAAEIGGEPERQRGRQHHGPVMGAQGGLGDVEDPAGPAGNRAPLDQHPLNDQAEGDGDHGEIGPGDPERGGGDRGADDRRDHDGRGDGGPLGRSGASGAERGRVGADGVEARVAERGLAGEAHQHVEPGRHDCQEPDGHGDVEVVRVGREERNDRGRRGEGGPAQPVHHTRLEGLSPRSPHGLMTSTRITSPKPTISRARVEI